MSDEAPTPPASSPGAPDEETPRRRWPTPDVLDELLVGRGGAADADEEDLVIPSRPAPLDREELADEDVGDDATTPGGPAPGDSGPPAPPRGGPAPGAPG